MLTGSPAVGRLRVERRVGQRKDNMEDIIKRLRIILPEQCEGQIRLEEEAAQKIERPTIWRCREADAGNRPRN